MTRFIFITGGVVSSLGKGLAAAAIGACLQARGYKVRLRKLDPYLNVDPGTMSPTQHGEVYVTDDGAETDLDLGHYERFTGVPSRQSDNTTAGRIYKTVLEKERHGDYLGGTVQVIPHVTDQIKTFILSDLTDEDFCLCEIGGTVGDIESFPFLEAIRQLRNELGRDRSLAMHVTLLPYVPTSGELKTKPTQHSVKQLLSVGIQPEILLCRTDRPIPETERRKIALFCNVEEKNVIAGMDSSSIYNVPLDYHAQGLDTQVCRYFNLPTEQEPDLSVWHDIVARITRPEGSVTIGIVGKYTKLLDSYKSLSEALTHGGIANNVGITLRWFDAEIFERNNPAPYLEGIHGILVPGGFGERGAEGKIAAAQYAREHKIPFFGICFGMQMAVIECARNLAGYPKASSSEFGPVEDPLVGLMTEWTRGEEMVRRSARDGLGGTMRLGAYLCHLEPGSKAHAIYGQNIVLERHRHRYEVNFNYRTKLEAAGLRFSGISPDGLLPEIIEYEDHPWFVGVQFHPELKSKPFAPHPLFTSFIKAAMEQSRLV